jgi:hypothetical protein
LACGQASGLSPKSRLGLLAYPTRPYILGPDLVHVCPNSNTLFADLKNAFFPRCKKYVRKKLQKVEKIFKPDNAARHHLLHNT